MNQPTSVSRTEYALIALGGMITLVLLSLLLYWTCGEPPDGRVATRFVWHWLELIFLGAVTGAVAISAALGSLGTRRFVNHIPLGASWWEFVVTGAVSFGLVLVLACTAAAGLLGLALLPVKVLTEYVLGAHASLWSAVVSVPVLFLFVTVPFGIAYATLCAQRRGVIEFRGRRILDATPIVLDGGSLGLLAYLSASVLLTGSAEGYTLYGTCRWIALLQALAGKLLEFVIAGVGLGLILNRMTAH